MAKDKDSTASSSHSVFEVNTIKELIELMQSHELTEVDLQQGDQRIKLRRGGPPVMTVPQSLPAYSGPVGHVALPTGSPTSPTTKPEPETPAGELILSPTIGTFYAAPKPGAPPFVKVGDMVGPDTIVCIVEAMKMFNEIPAGISGKVVEVLAKDGEPVDNNRPLFRVLPA